MTYDPGLAERVRQLLADFDGVDEREMFGGIAFMLNGNMACGVISDDLIVRVGKDHHEAALAEEHAKPFDFTGRPMAGWVMVAPEGVEESKQLNGWVEKGIETALLLPPK